MLPKQTPSVPGLDISVYMKPATEVGGDYYDFKYDINESLIIGIGDATGHGMKAGTMVATIKSLFTAESIDTNIVSFLNKSNSVIKEMTLGNLFMAMLMVKLNRNKAMFSSAGMPPSLVFRSSTKTIDEIRLQAMPLGGPNDSSYPEKEVILSPGDTILLMSDGFPELFNDQKEILGYDKAKSIFHSVAEKAPDKIIEHLCSEADKWKGNAQQEDDITFVVVKVR
jgi:serine phosphatase RsbU (regulator of sigma subunit)